MRSRRARTDFGVVVWEMLTGARLFAGETASHTLADVLRAPIDFSRLRAPRPIVDLVRRCLDRDTKTRLRDIGEARVAIASYLAKPDVGEERQPARSRLGLVGVVAATAVSLALGGLAAWWWKPAPEAPLLQVEVSLPRASASARWLTASPRYRLTAPCW